VLRKVLTYIGWFLLVALFGAYFFFASLLEVKGREDDICTGIKVTILDSTINRFVSEEEVKSIIASSDLKVTDKKIDDINPYQLEQLLDKRSAIKLSDVAIDREGVLHVEITQRRPLLRIQGKDGGFYVDESCYVFPLVKSFTSYVPIVTGEIPLSLTAGQRGKVDNEGEKWLSSMLNFGEYLRNHEFWNSQIQQIEILPNGDIALYMRVGDQTVIIGELSDYEEKFRKLEAFYKNAVPIHGWNKYSEINLKYDDQVVCTLKKEKNDKKI
jgi:cell division protein FtsQ